jgi:tetratricopeptide (TPR) repeat protein
VSKREVDPVVQWNATLEFAENLIAARDTTQARFVLDELISFVNRTWGPEDVHLIRPLRLMAASYFWEHEPLDPENGSELECLRRALAIARRRLGDDHREVAALAGQVGHALVVAGSIEDGCALMTECLGIATQLGEVDAFSRYFGLIGDARMAQGRPDEAVGLYEHAVATCKRIRPSSISLAVAQYSLGKCLRQLGRSKEAVVELELALTIAKADRDPGFIVAVRDELARAARGA